MAVGGLVVMVTLVAAITTAGGPGVGGDGGPCPVATVGALDGPDPWGGCWPGLQTTGVTDEGALTTVVGDVTISVDGTVYQNKIVSGGCIEVTADNVTIRNVRVNMPSASGCVYGICNSVESCGAGDGGSNTNLLVEDVEVNCGTTDRVGRAAIIDEDYTARRSYFHGNCTNTVGINGSDVLFENNFVDEPQVYVPATDPHTDGIQMPDSSSVIIRHNVIYGEYTDAGNFGSGSVNIGGSSYSSILVTRNIIAGGGYSVYCPTSGSALTFTENRFSTVFSSTVGGYGPIYVDHCPGSHTWTGNVYHDGPDAGDPVE